jgi:CheY-like chemotaxis protein
MSNQRKQILIAEDDFGVQTVMGMVLTEEGYSVRSSSDGFAALAQMKVQIPDVLISDLNMPGMSGFELLSVVRRRFPTVRTIAMSGAYDGNTIPPEIASDAFYGKGKCSLTDLLDLVRDVIADKGLPRRQPDLPIWVSLDPRVRYRTGQIAVTCPECLRTFPCFVGNASSRIVRLHCLYCFSSAQYSILPSALATTDASIPRGPSAPFTG